MQYRILGPVEALAGGRLVALGGPLERALLSRLLLEDGRTVSPAQLVEDLWEGEPPDSAQVSVRVRISKLRKALAGAGASDAVTTGPSGYALQLRDDDSLDARDFEEKARLGRAALKAGAANDAARILGDGLALWRGPALAGVGEAPFARVEAARLEEQRLGAIGDQIDARQAMGEDAETLSDLEMLCARYALNERLWAQRMLALYRCGRQADALAAYRQLVEVLREELGIDPSAELVELERRILKHSPDLASKPRALAESLPSGVVTFVLTDIEGSTELWEKHASAMAGALQRHEEIVGQSVVRRGGSLIKSRGEGDATLSVYHRASDAVGAALDLTAALSVEPWPEGIALRTRVAVHTGEAQERDGDYFGGAVNRAARVRALAQGGQILLSRVTAELVRDQLTSGAHLADLGERALRGFSRGEHVFELLPGSAVSPSRVSDPGALPIPPLPETLAALIGGPFIGRERELEQLSAALSEAKAGALRCRLVAGEPGIGKTRLTAEFAKSAHDDGAVVLYGRCDEEPAVPYQPFVEALRRWAHVLTPSQRAGIPQAEHLVQLVPELTSVAAAQPRDDPEVERYRFFEAVASTLAHAALAGPLVVVLDDLHWADRPTLQLLRHVMRMLDSTPMLLVGTYRESDLSRTRPFADTLHDLRRERSFERIRLSGLDETEIIELFERTIEHDVGRRGRALAHALSETTDGNPFFIEQVIGNLVETGRLVQREGRTVLEARVDELAIPEGVIEAVGRRLSRLSELCNQTLTAGSVLGREFEVNVLIRMLERDPDDVLAALDEAVTSGLVREVPASGRIPTYTFAHALVQQTLYGELSLARKQRLHLRAAAAIESAHASNLEPYVMPLARHLRAGGAAADASKTIDYSIRAMEVARRVFAFDDAIGNAEAALELIEETEAAPASQARIRERLGDLVHVAGADYQSSIANLEQALTMYEALGDNAGCARVHAKLGRAFVTYWGSLDIPRAQRHLDAAKRLFGPSPDLLNESRLALTVACAALYAWDIPTAEEATERVLEIGGRIGDSAISSIGMQLKGWCAMWAGRIDDGLILAEQAWQLADGIDHLAAAFASTWLVGPTMQTGVDANESVRFLMRELDKPRLAQATNMRLMLLATARDSLAVAGDIEGAKRLMEDLQPAAHPEIFTGWSNQLSLVTGDWEAARRHADEGVARHRLSGSPPMLGFVLDWQAQVLIATGAVDEARRTLQEAVEIAAPWTQLASRGRLAVLDASDGRTESARAQIHRCVEILQKGNGWRGSLGLVARARGALAAAEGRMDDAGNAFSDAAQTSARHGFPWEEANTLHLWGRALLDSQEPSSAVEKFDAALEIYRKHGAGPQWAQRVLVDRARAE